MIVFIVTYYRFRTKQLAAAERQPLLNAADPKLLEAAEKERKALEARIQNLESIVCSVDFEINQRLNRVLAEQSVAIQSPAAAAAARRSGGTVSADPLAWRAQPPVSGTEQTAAGYALGFLAPGQVVLGRYTVERELGRGGMGAVYLARDAKLSERVALKTISSAMAGDPEATAERFRMEVQAARKVTHPNVIRIHDLGEDGSLLFLSMEYIEGETLFQRVKRVGPLPIGEARRLLGEVAAGVSAAHAAGVIHRGLKTHNVLIPGPTARVIKGVDLGPAETSLSPGTTDTRPV